MPTTVFNTGVAASGENFPSEVVVLSDAQVYQRPQANLPIGRTGSLTTRTDDDTGVAAADTGHGLVTGKIDIYWGTANCRYGMDATVAGDVVTIDGGEGDNLPAAETDLIMSQQVVLEVDLVGNLVMAIGARAQKRSHIQFLDADDVHIVGASLPAGQGWNWIAGLGFDNPLANKIVGKIVASCGDPVDATELMIIIPYNNS